MLIKFVLIFLISTALTALITPFFRKFAIKNGLVDVPNDRKMHIDAIPRVGGIAIVLSFLAAYTLGYGLFHTKLIGSIEKSFGLLMGGFFIFALGILDDIKGLNANKKFGGQIVATIPLLLFGYLIKSLDIPFIGVRHLGVIGGIALTAFWIVGITNTFNMIDGMDGLSSGVVIFASITLFIVSFLAENLFVAILSLALLGSTLGFLLHNWHPAKIFMGDCGAMFLGFTLAALFIETSYKSATGNAIFVPVLALFLPIVDTAYAILRRKLSHKSIVTGDRGHIHHKLLDAGFTVRQAALILYGVCIFFQAAALATTFVTTPFAVAIAVFALILSVLGVKILAHVAGHSSQPKA